MEGGKVVRERGRERVRKRERRKRGENRRHRSNHHLVPPTTISRVYDNTSGTHEDK